MIQVREYAQLTTDKTALSSLDLAIIKQETFDWLVELSAKENYGRFITYKRPQYLQLHSYVGYLESPCGEGIEILPKTGLGLQEPDKSRAVLCKILSSLLNLSHKEAQSANLNRMNLPIHEWIYYQFLYLLKELVASGLRFDYQRIEEESRFIRGQLDITVQQRQTVGRAHLFHIRHDVYHPNRLENQLIKTALDYVHQHCRSSENWRLANELSHILEPITSLRDPLNSMPKWSDIKILQSYRAIKPWCQLILEKLNPNFQKGEHRGIALLFPMEILFEKYVASCLRRDIKAPWQLTTQASSKYMVNDQEGLKSRFQLKPDLLISQERKNHHILDTKWKLISSNSNKKNFNIEQDDIYQLFAYGHKYLNGCGDMMLIYPKHHQFETPLDCFHLAGKLRLWAIPFCIKTDKLVIGEWVERFPSLSHT